MSQSIQIPVTQVGLEASIAAAMRRVGSSSQINLGTNSRQINALSQPLGRITGQADEFSKSMGAANARVLAFGASAGIIYGVSRAMSGLVKSTIQVEKSLVEINAVLGKSGAELDKFGQGIFNVAKNTGKSFGEVATGALELARQGLSAEETLTRLNDALILSRLSGLDATKSVEGLTAAFNSFKSSGISTSEILNNIVAVAQKFAVSEKDIIEGLGRSASVADLAGVSFNELASIITAIQEKTARGGAVIGNSLKTIFARIQDKAVLSDLQDMGIAVTGLRGDVLPALKILENLAAQMDGFSQIEQADIAKKLGGVYQLDKLLAALKDLSSESSVYREALKEIETAGGSAYKKNAVLNETLASIINKVTVSAEQLGAKLGEIGVTDSLKNILGFFNNLLEGIQKVLGEESGLGTLVKGLVKGLGNLFAGPGLALFGAIILKLSKDLVLFGFASLKAFFGIGQAAKEVQNVESAISQVLARNVGLQQQLFALEGNRAAQLRVITTALVEQEALLRRSAAISSGLAGPLSRVGVRATDSGLRITNRAGGYMPAVAKESQAINSGVGGARRGDKPVVMPNFNFGGGKKGTVVAHTGEYVVPNFGGGKGSAIFNRDMVQKMGLPNGAKKITASGGLIPNFANKKLNFNQSGKLSSGDEYLLKNKEYSGVADIGLDSLSKNAANYRKTIFKLKGESLDSAANRIINKGSADTIRKALGDAAGSTDVELWLKNREIGAGQVTPLSKRSTKKTVDFTKQKNGLFSAVKGALFERYLIKNRKDIVPFGEGSTQPLDFSFKQNANSLGIEAKSGEFSTHQLIAKAIRARYGAANKNKKPNTIGKIGNVDLFVPSLASGFIPNFARKFNAETVRQYANDIERYKSPTKDFYEFPDGTGGYGANVRLVLSRSQSKAVSNKQEKEKKISDKGFYNLDADALGGILLVSPRFGKSKGSLNTSMPIGKIPFFNQEKSPSIDKNKYIKLNGIKTANTPSGRDLQALQGDISQLFAGGIVDLAYKLYGNTFDPASGGEFASKLKSLDPSKKQQLLPAAAQGDLFEAAGKVALNSFANLESLFGSAEQSRPFDFQNASALQKMFGVNAKRGEAKRGGEKNFSSSDQVSGIVKKVFNDPEYSLTALESLRGQGAFNFSKAQKAASAANAFDGFIPNFANYEDDNIPSYVRKNMEESPSFKRIQSLYKKFPNMTYLSRGAESFAFKNNGQVLKVPTFKYAGKDRLKDKIGGINDMNWSAASDQLSFLAPNLKIIPPKTSGVVISQPFAGETVGNVIEDSKKGASIGTKASQIFNSAQRLNPRKPNWLKPLSVDNGSSHNFTFLENLSQAKKDYFNNPKTSADEIYNRNKIGLIDLGVFRYFSRQAKEEEKKITQGSVKAGGFIPNFSFKSRAIGFGKKAIPSALDIANQVLLDGMIDVREVAMIAKWAKVAGPEALKKLKSLLKRGNLNAASKVNLQKLDNLTVRLPLQNRNNAASGFLPNFANPLQDAVGREMAAGVPASQIYIDKSPSLKNAANPMGLMVANRRDEPAGGFQGINRARKEGANPMMYGAAGGFVPNYAVSKIGEVTKENSNLAFGTSRQQIDSFNKGLQGITVGLRNGSIKFNEAMAQVAKLASATGQNATQAKRLGAAGKSLMMAYNNELTARNQKAQQLKQDSKENQRKSTAAGGNAVRDNAVQGGGGMMLGLIAFQSAVSIFSGFLEEAGEGGKKLAMVLQKIATTALIFGGIAFSPPIKKLKEFADQLAKTRKAARDSTTDGYFKGYREGRSGGNTGGLNLLGRAGGVAGRSVSAVGQTASNIGGGIAGIARNVAASPIGKGAAAIGKGAVATGKFVGGAGRIVGSAIGGTAVALGGLLGPAALAIGAFKIAGEALSGLRTYSNSAAKSLAEMSIYAGKATASLSELDKAAIENESKRKYGVSFDTVIGSLQNMVGISAMASGFSGIESKNTNYKSQNLTLSDVSEEQFKGIEQAFIGAYVGANRTKFATAEDAAGAASKEFGNTYVINGSFGTGDADSVKDAIKKLSAEAQKKAKQNLLADALKEAAVIDEMAAKDVINFNKVLKSAVDTIKNLRKNLFELESRKDIFKGISESAIENAYNLSEYDKTVQKLIVSLGELSATSGLKTLDLQINTRENILNQAKESIKGFDTLSAKAEGIFQDIVNQIINSPNEKLNVLSEKGKLTVGDKTFSGAGVRELLGNEAVKYLKDASEEYVRQNTELTKQNTLAENNLRLETLKSAMAQKATLALDIQTKQFDIQKSSLEKIFDLTEKIRNSRDKISDLNFERGLIGATETQKLSAQIGRAPELERRAREASLNTFKQDRIGSIQSLDSLIPSTLSADLQFSLKNAILNATKQVRTATTLDTVSSVTTEQSNDIIKKINNAVVEESKNRQDFIDRLKDSLGVSSVTFGNTVIDAAKEFKRIAIEAANIPLENRKRELEGQKEDLIKRRDIAKLQLGKKVSPLAAIDQRGFEKNRINEIAETTKGINTLNDAIALLETKIKKFLPAPVYSFGGTPKFIERPVPDPNKLTGPPPITGLLTEDTSEAAKALESAKLDLASSLLEISNSSANAADGLEKVESVSRMLGDEFKQLQEGIPAAIAAIISERNKSISGAEILGANYDLETQRQYAGAETQEERGKITRDRKNKGLGQLFAEEYGKTPEEQALDLNKTIVDGSVQFKNNMIEAMMGAIEGTGSLKDGLRSAAYEFVKTINQRMMSNLVDKIVGGSVQSGGGGGGGLVQGIGSVFSSMFGSSAPVTAAAGGMINGGSGSKDDVPAMLMGGEYVVNKKAVSKYGAQFLESINNGSLTGYAQGGAVQRGPQGNFYTPGTFGTGAIEGKRNLLDFATQTGTTGQFDKMINQSGYQAVDLEPESSKLSVSGMRNSPQFAATQSAKEQAFDLYLQQYNAEQEAAKAKKEAKKAFRKQLMMLAISAVAAPVIQAGAVGFKEAFKNAAGQGLDKQLLAGVKGIGVGSNGIGGLTTLFSSVGKTFAGDFRGAGAEFQRSQGIIPKAIPVSGISKGISAGAAKSRVTQGLSSNFSNNELALPTYPNEPSSPTDSLVSGEIAKRRRAISILTSRYNYTPDEARDFVASNSGSDISSLIRKNDLDIQQRANSTTPIFGRATGGMIPSTSGIDTVPAMLSGGEFVMNRSAVQGIGASSLQSMNSGGTSITSEETSKKLNEQLLAKLDELISASGSTGDITINVDSSGKSTENTSGGSSEERQNFARQIRAAVLQVINDEKRIGGTLRR